MRSSWTPALTIASTSGSSSRVPLFTTTLFDDGARLDAGRGPAVLGGDDAVLRHVDQPAGEIARVGGLERGVGEAFAGAVGRVEVLEHREPFLEVRDDRGLDDLARRLGHQAAHAGELAHLR